MDRVRIKICGITRVDDALAAARLGVDAIGLVFYAGSPRAVTPAQAAAIVRALPPLVTTVGLFVDADEAEVMTVLQQVPIDLLQFHGHEDPEYCDVFPRPYIKALRMKTGLDVVAEADRYHGARGLLLDTYQAEVAGGTGRVFDWTTVPAGLKRPIILAGGLTADNVAAGISRLKPWAVDVSGGVEAAPGIKDSNRMGAFVTAVNNSLE